MNPRKSVALAEEIFERSIQLLDGPVNRMLEKICKNKWLLAPLGLSITLGARTAIAWREGNLHALWSRRDLPPEVGEPWLDERDDENDFSTLETRSDAAGAEVAISRHPQEETAHGSI